MVCVRVDKNILAGHNPDVSVPENQIAAQIRLPMVEISAKAALLVAVARTFHTAGQKRHLHEARTINPPARRPAPQIRRAEQQIRYTDGVRKAGFERLHMCARHEMSRRDFYKITVIGDDLDLTSKENGNFGRGFISGFGYRWVAGAATQCEGCSSPPSAPDTT